MTQFRKRGGLPQLRSSTNSNYPRLPASRRRGQVPGLGRTVSSRESRPRFVLIGIALAVFIVGAVIAAPSWLPAISWVVPDRYVMAYAPASIQRMIFQVDPAEQVPAPAVASGGGEELLAELAPTATATLPPPAAGVSAPGGYVQPTPLALAPTPTLTPVFSIQVDSHAVDRDNSADLGDITALLTGFEWEQQGYNNCGPASIRTLMSYWGVEFTETQAASYLKPDPEDPNVRPDEIAEYVEQYNYHALIRVDGNFDIIKKFILAGYPVLIESGYDPEPETVGWTSHYLTIAGFSNDGFIVMDTYRRPNWFYAYNEVDYYWRQFNRRYVIIYKPEQLAAVASIIGEDMDDTVMNEGALASARAESSLNHDDPYAWFNLGSTLVSLGRYEDAAAAFDEARTLGLPSRFLWYQFSPYEAYLQVGRYEDVITLADAVLAKKSSEEAFYYKGLALEGLGEMDKARVQIALAVRYNQNYQAAKEALAALEN
jgi:tetratricopeptide (TPR) repeat protein